MAHAGQEIQSPGGMHLRFVRTGAETDGELLEMAARAHDGQVVAHDSVARLRSLMALPSLEQVFRTLVIETDIDGLANDLVANMKR